MSPKLTIVAAALLLLPLVAQADIPKDKIKIGVLQDLPEPYASLTGNGGIVAAQLAASDFETEHVHGDAEILPGASGNTMEQDIDQVRDWINKEHVAAILSSAGPGVDARIAKMVEKVHATLLIAATDEGVSPKLCSPNVVVWGAGPGARARALAQTLVSRGNKKWFVLSDQTPAALEGQAALHDAVSDAGGQIVGTHDHAVGESDLRKVVSKINQADAQVIALSESEADLVAALRSASMAGLSHQTTLAAPFARIADVDNAGLAPAEGLMVATPYYWDTDDQTRRFAKRWSKRMQAQHVTENAAEVYAATLSFLHAAKAVDDVESSKVVAQLRHAPIKGTLFGTVTVRKDGRVLHDVGVYQVMQQNQVQQRWAYYRKVASVPGDKAFPPSACQ